MTPSWDFQPLVFSLQRYIFSPKMVDAVVFSLCLRRLSSDERAIENVLLKIRIIPKDVRRNTKRTSGFFPL